MQIIVFFSPRTFTYENFKSKICSYLTGLILVPNGKDIGHALGDFYPSEDLLNYSNIYSEAYFSEFKNESATYDNITFSEPKNFTAIYGNFTSNETERDSNFDTPELSDAQYAHPWGVLFTVLGTVLLDFDADSCQSPARAYLLDVTLPGEFKKNKYPPTTLIVLLRRRMKIVNLTFFSQVKREKQPFLKY